ncbi:hypothetical protein FWD07_02025 [Candidatus Saccharibacteria bacterium]|nr:hypothetical protein [Candidatus Saccharibacteria bacterium]
MKKAWACLTKKVRLQKCETGFKDDVKNSVLARVVMRRPELVKPLGVAMEVLAVVLVIVMVWSVAEVVKGGAAMIAFGTCDVRQPSACVLGTGEACNIDGERLGFIESIRTGQPHRFVTNWFSEFGEAFSGIPVRFRNWDAMDYIPENASFYRDFDWGLPIALKILDPGCGVCRDSYLNKLDSGFMDRYNLAFLAYPIPGVQGEEWAFRNSYLIVRYIEAVRSVELEWFLELEEGEGEILRTELATDWMIIDRLFTGFDEMGRQYQDAFNASYSAEEAEERLQSWLREWGFSEEELEQIVDRSRSGEVRATIETNMNVVDNVIRTKMIPTMIFDGRRWHGLYS